MNEFGNMNTRLPYGESESYVDALVERSKEAAMQQGRTQRKINRSLVYSLAGVAAAAAIVFAVMIPFNKKAVQPDGSPMDTFLASLSDSEVAMIVDWSIEDIPEYY